MTEVSFYTINRGITIRPQNCGYLLMWSIFNSTTMQKEPKRTMESSCPPSTIRNDARIVLLVIDAPNMKEIAKA